MTALSDHAIEPTITTGPITGSRKIYRQVGELRVPARRVELSNGEHVDLYDTSGPYTEPDAAIGVNQGLPRLRAPWIAAREPATQLAWARSGVVTPEMEFIAAREGVDVEMV